MPRLFQAGFFAACIQCMAAGLATVVILLTVRHVPIILVSPNVGADTPSEFEALLPILRGSYLAIALVIALTNNPVVYFTAERIRFASHLMRPSDPDYATKSLLTQLTLASIGFAILALRPPPTALLDAVSGGCAWAASVTWSGFMSIAVAGFGANAQAAKRAL
ncbi:hypothetical protein LGH82_04920 [Mesorhizobium sp. PAMC28654]|uniref:hypothetical protein n=1 Tax=Mesorhizobium sp. PAMC28654 TaxID=2880934 RepID=UPI001D09A42F|nr:hypothetical protein [Mesorhizobium sp. PAMC28654]UDL90677.1 hypothetical protein LGH82_04920 [Mesorhizobium sp. PAMC28654]